MTNFVHVPVLLDEVVTMLNPGKETSYIDATAGGGGHTQVLVDYGARVLALDQDEEAVAHLKQKFAGSDAVTVVQGNFLEVKALAEEHGFTQVEGVLFDLGVSSFQLDASSRGFSFMRDEALDMRMSKETSLTARTIVNTWSEEKLADIFAKYGEEQEFAKVANAIVEARAEKRIETTQELVAIVKRVIRRSEKIHPATRVFQALRIAVNNELDVLRAALESSVHLVKPKRRVAVISFHSLEDRIVKNAFRSFEQKGLGTMVTKKPIIATGSEIQTNPRSRSAKLRIFEKRED